MPVVRDAEIEALVRDYARPIFKAAGLSKSGIDIILVNDPRFNAFVAGRRMFINTGALLQAETPNEIIGVIAHEAGHIAGGHQDRLREQIAARADHGGHRLAARRRRDGRRRRHGHQRPRARPAPASWPAATRWRGAACSAISAPRRATADQSAIKYLEATGQSAKGMLITFERFQSALSLSGARVDPYQVSHPMPRDRIANLETLAKSSPHYDDKDSEALQQRHDMMRAKIAVYTQGQAAASRLFRKMPGSLAAQYGDAQAALLFGNPQSALKKADALIKIAAEEPVFPRIARRHPAARQPARRRRPRPMPGRCSSIRRSRASCRSPTARR